MTPQDANPHQTAPADLDSWLEQQPETIPWETLTCVDCGYHLFGLPTRGRCPECGGPIWVALAAGWLVVAPPAWLRTLDYGVKALFATVFGLLLAMIIQYSAGFRTPLLSAALGLLILLGVVVCLWLLTSPHPGRRLSERRWSPRRVARAMLIGTVAAAFLGEALRRNAPAAVLTGSAYTLFRLLPVLIGIGLTALAWHYRGLCIDVGFGPGVRMNSTYGIGMTICTFALAPLLFAPWVPALGYVSACAAIFALLFGGWIVAFPGHFGTQLRQLAQQAEAIRAQPDLRAKI